MKDEIVISVYCTSASDSMMMHGTFRNKLMHPIDEVRKAYNILLRTKDKKATAEQFKQGFYSNSCDFVFAMKHIGNAMDVNVKFYLDGVCKENDIEEIFETFNKAYKLVDEICDMITHKKESDAIDTLKLASSRVGIKEKQRFLTLQAFNDENENRRSYIDSILSKPIDRAIMLGQINHEPEEKLFQPVIVGHGDVGKHSIDYLKIASESKFHIVPSISNPVAVNDLDINLHRDMFLNHDKYVGMMNTPIVWDMIKADKEKIEEQLIVGFDLGKEKGYTMTKTSIGYSFDLETYNGNEIGFSALDEIRNTNETEFHKHRQVNPKDYEHLIPILEAKMNEPIVEEETENEPVNEQKKIFPKPKSDFHK